MTTSEPLSAGLINHYVGVVFEFFESCSFLLGEVKVWVIPVVVLRDIYFPECRRFGPRFGLLLWVVSRCLVGVVSQL